MKTSGFLRLNLKDFLKGLLTAVIGGLIDVVHTTVTAGSLDIKPDELLKVGVITGTAYLAKNLFTPQSTIAK